MNPIGERSVSEDEFFFAIKGIFSSVDSQEKPSSFASATHQRDTWMAANEKKNLYRYVEDGCGVTLFSQRVTAKWVWQAHPYPVVITSTDSAIFYTNSDGYFEGGEFPVKADGLCPAFYLENAPAGFSIDRDTGVMSIPPGLEIET